ncbi:MAG: hypothetical protein IIZ70_04325 [Kiritimatiellae bacterium]|nr:hypothetical protein [Kiritimatiellia bacterium]
MEVAEAFGLVSHAIDSGRAAHGYLVVGDLHGSCDEFVDLVLGRLSLALGHPDVAMLKPQGKSRTIKVEKTQGDDGPGMRDGIVEPMSTSSFSGGWKVGIISGADRMQEAAANAFLKTLEEPPEKTLFLLLTDAPDGMLPTIVSRTQRIDLPLSEGLLEGEFLDAVSAVFASGKPPVGVFERSLAAKHLDATLKELEGSVDDADVAQARKAFYKTIMSFVRGWMEEGRLERYKAFRNIEAVEEAARRSDRHVPGPMVLASMMERIAFPS